MGLIRQFRDNQTVTYSCCLLSFFSTLVEYPLEGFTLLKREIDLSNALGNVQETGEGERRPFAAILM